MLWFLKNFSSKKTVLLFFGALLGSAVLVLPSAAFAQVAFDFGLSDIANIGLGGADIRIIIVRLIRVALGFLGIVAIIIVLYGGYLWMTAGGNAQRVDLAKNVLKNGFIGLVIILAAYTIVAFIIGTFINRILDGGGGPGPGPCTNCSALGGGIIEDHYPGRNARDIPRNVHLSITFKEPIYVDPANPRSFMLENPVGSGDWFSNDNVFLLTEVLGPQSFGSPVAMAAVTNNFRIFTLYPQGLLGYPDHDSTYRATVKGGATGLAKAADLAWRMGGDYTWDFSVSTFLDTTPPRVIDVYPVDGQTEARSVSVVMTFSESIDPVSIVYDISSSNTLLFRQAPPAPLPPPPAPCTAWPCPVDGVTDVTNGYRTVTFHTSVKCGVNSCGQDIFCFEANAAIDGLIKAATLLGVPRLECPSNSVNDALRLQNNPSAACVSPTPTPTLFYDGIVDMAGNSLDGSPGVAPAPPLPSGNGTANGPIGPPSDNYIWTFNTDDKIVKGGPKIAGIAPTNEQAGVSQTDPAQATFNRRLLRFTTDDFRFYESGSAFYPIWAGQSINYDCGVTGEACFPESQSKVCVLGSNDGKPCAEDINCPGGSCQTVRVCRGGTNDGNACTVDADCPGAPPGVCPIAACPAPPPSEERNSCGRSVAVLNHETFAENKVYEPRVGSTVLDIYQNCFLPTVGPFICDSGANIGQSCSVPPAAADCPGGLCVPSYNNLGETTLGVDQ